MKRIIVLSVIALIVLGSFVECYADEGDKDVIIEKFGLEYMQDLKIAIEEAIADTELDELPDFGYEDLMSSWYEEDNGFSLKKAFDAFINIFMKEIKINLAVSGLIIIVALLIGVSEALCNQSGADSIKFVGVFIITGLVVDGFTMVCDLVGNVFDNAMTFMNVLFPSLLAVMAATGNPGVSSAFSPVMYVLMQLVGFVFRTVLVPVITLMFFMSVLSSMSGNMNFSRMYEFVKHICKWTTGIMFTVFVSITGFYAMISSTVEGLAGKALKQTVSGVVPVVGNMIADTTDVVVGSLSVIKNGVGVVGMIIVVIVCVVPIIKIFAVNVLYRFTASVIEPVTDKNITEMIWSAAETYNYLTAVLAGVMIMFVLSLAIVLSASNASIMYR